MAALSKSFIDSRPIPATGYRAYWDKVPGFGIRIMSSGRKTFIAIGRLRGRNVTVTIGAFGLYTVEDARKEARDILHDLRRGEDPRVKRRKAQTAEITLRQLADEYMARPGKLKDSSKEHIDRHVRTTFEDIEHRPVMDIDENFCRARYQKMFKHGLRGNRKNGSPGQANQAFDILKALINYAIRRHKLPMQNPVHALDDDWVELKERESYVPDTRIGAVWAFLLDARERAYNRADLSGIEVTMFQFLSGCRFSEAAKLTWDRINLEEGWWHLPNPKNGRPIWLPLSTQAVEMLDQRHRLPNNPHVFVGRDAHSHIKDPRSVWQRITKLCGERITSHDTRRTLITHGFAQLGIDLPKLELLTGHKLQGVTAKHYLEVRRLQYLKPELQRYADWLYEKAEQAAGTNVVKLRA